MSWRTEKKRQLATKIDVLLNSQLSLCASAAVLDYQPLGIPTDEYNECWTRSLMKASGLSYYEVNRRIGRKEGQRHGMPCRFVLQGYGYDFQKAGQGGVLKDFVFPEGTLIAETPGHVFAVVDGIAHDNIPPQYEDGWEQQQVLGWWKNVGRISNPKVWLAGRLCCSGKAF